MGITEAFGGQFVNDHFFCQRQLFRLFLNIA